MYAKKIQVRYRYSEFVINNMKRIRDKDIIQEHPMVWTETKDERSKKQEDNREQGHSTKVWKPMTFYTDESERRIYNIEYSKKNRNDFQDKNNYLIQVLTS